MYVEVHAYCIQNDKSIINSSTWEKIEQQFVNGISDISTCHTWPYSLFPRFSALAFIRLECKHISEDQEKQLLTKWLLLYSFIIRQDFKGIKLSLRISIVHIFFFTFRRNKLIAIMLMVLFPNNIWSVYDSEEFKQLILYPVAWNEIRDKQFDDFGETFHVMKF